MRILSRFFIFSSLALCAFSAMAAEEYTITIKDHKFSPAELTVPANEKIKLTIINEDASSEEFESHDLNRDKLISANGKAIIHVGPLQPGSYKFVGEFHPETAQGVLIVK